MKSDLLVFGEDWGAHPSSTQHLIKHLSQQRRTLWVNSIGLRRPRLSLKDTKRLFKKGLSLLEKKAPIDTNGPVEIIPPKAVPWPGNSFANFCNKRLLAPQIKEKLNAHKIHKPIFWTSLPTAVDILQQFSPKAVVYYCGDDFSALDGVDHAPVVECEKRLSDKADLIIVASEKLAAKFPKEKTITLPHGVDFELFSKPIACAEECKTNRPIAGFYGSIADWVDIELIAHTADQLPTWDFMFVGPIKTDVSQLLQLENIKFIPAQPHEKLPSFVQHWKAALLPFKNNQQIKACNPLKLREYLASNTPVVTTDFPALEPYRHIVKTIKNASEMVEALLNISPTPMQSSSVQQESWQNRAKQVDQHLERLETLR